MSFKYAVWKHLPEFLRRPIFGYITKHPEWYGMFTLTGFLNGEIEIGKGTVFTDGDTVIHTAKGAKVCIGNYGCFARGCKMVTHNHPTTYPSMSDRPFLIGGEDGKEDMASLKNITIGNDVWCGFNVVILSGVTVGDGAIIGA